ncbi:MAG: MG2 domain-containing protein [Bacteroidota bacterium]
MPLYFSGRNACSQIRLTTIIIPFIKPVYMLRHLFVSVYCLILITSCNRNSVSVSYTNAKDEVPQLGNLIFRFSQPIAPDSLLNTWDSTGYISFEPAIEGRFRWAHPDELVFSPAKPLMPATSYKADLKKSLLKHSKFNKLEDAEDIRFKTADLHLENSNVMWTLSDGSNTAVPQVDLLFNYPVKPNDVKDKMLVTVDETKVDYQLQTLSSEPKLSVRIIGLKVEDRDYKVSIKLDKGLIPDGGKNGTPETQDYQTIISSPYTLNINDVSTDHDGITGSIYVKTSQQPTKDKLSQLLQLSPAITYNTEIAEDGFIISSEQFDVNNTYSLTLLKGLRGNIGGVLKEAYTTNLAFGKLEPALSFGSSKSVYLNSKGNKNIEVKISGVNKVKVIISKIYESNLLAANRYGYYPQETNNNESDENEYYEGDDGDATLGDVIYEKEIDTRTLPKFGSSRLFQFNIADRVNEFKGIYHVKIRSTEDYWVSDSRFLSLSDIGLVAKEGSDKILVFANSIKTSKPNNGVNVLVYGANNQLLGSGNTNEDGVAEIAYTRKDFSGFKPAMIIAKSADDFNYLPFNNTRVNTSRFDVGGKRINSTGLDAYIYAERDVYRPGEKMNFSVIVRDLQFKSPGEIPVKMLLLMPNGKELVSFRKNLNGEGSAEGNVQLNEGAVTGSYLLEVYNGNDVLLATQNFKVEAFMPDRIKVNATLNKVNIAPGTSTTLAIQATNYFGPPAAGRKYECEIQVKEKAFNPKKYDRFEFGLSNQKTFFDKVVRQGKTSDAGTASESFDVPAIYKNIGLLQARFFATVFDETGRPVSRNAAADIYTQNIFLGVGNSGNYYVSLNTATRFPLIALNVNQQPVTTTANVQIIKHEYRTVLSKSGDLFRYQSEKQDKLLISQNIVVKGETTVYPFVPRSPGEYEFRVLLPGAIAYVSQKFYSYGSWGSDNSSFEVNTEGNIDIELDKDNYQKGETVKALFKAPFNGKMLVTLETDKVVSYQYITTQNRTASLDLPLKEAHLPNVYITATLFKPHDISDIPLTVAHGFKNIAVADKEKRINVSISAAEKVRSKTRQTVTVKAKPNAMVTLAAVDNGVLSVSSFRTPDPYTFYYSQRALGVQAYDLYPLLFPELRARLSSTGGDADLEMNQRQNPMPNKRVKLLSYWSGIQKANSSGQATFEVDIPPFSGQVRLMAVSYKDDCFGAAEATMTVADPLVISTALPRFLSPADTVLVPVTISNTTSKAANIVATVKTNDLLSLVGTASQTSTVNANSEAVVVFKLLAGNIVSASKVRVEVKGMGELFVDETEISVRPASSLQKLTGSGSINANTSQQIAINTSDFIASGAKYDLVISRSPAMELGSQLQFLVNYPYGCTEQVISAAFPQLYYADLSELMHYGQGMQKASVENVVAAINKIKMRQLYNGAVGLWDDEASENWWTTVYAAHFLLEAQKAGYPSDKSLLSTMLNYITNRLRNKTFITYIFNRTQQKKIAPKEVAYSLYVLALAGKPNISAMNYYKANQKELALDSRYLLSVAYAIAGDKNKYNELLPATFAGEESVPETGGSFYSDIRDESIALNALLDVDPANRQVPVMAKHVADKLKARSWYSTQESAFSFLAIGKLARKSNKVTSTAEISVNGKKVATMNNASLRLSKSQLGGSLVSIKVQGNGPLYYFWQSQGISASGAYKEEDSFLKVRRVFFDRFGRQITGNSFKQNDLIVVQVSLSKTFSGTVENIVATDIIPAGFEIENPRIKDLPGMEWIKDAATPTAYDIRDDRIHFFTDLASQPKVFYYTVRAVSPGTYKMGPVSADAMYNGEYHSYWGGGVVSVLQ